MAEATIAEKLKQLYELQLIDSQIDEIEILKGELPIEVSDLEDDIVGLETRVQRLDTIIKDIEIELGHHERNILEAETLIERYKVQIDNVKNNREFEALTKEIELQNLEIQLSQKKIRATKSDLETKQATLQTTTERKERQGKALETKKVELAQIIEKTEKEEEKLRKKSDKARKNIEERLIRAYDKTRNAYRNGLAVVTISRDSCGGCFNKIPPQLQLEIAMRKKIIACEHCGRVLVDDFILEGEKKETTEA